MARKNGYVKEEVKFWEQTNECTRSQNLFSRGNDMYLRENEFAVFKSVSNGARISEEWLF